MGGKTLAPYIAVLALGMIEEGTIREHIYKGGQWRDSVVHAMLDHEWRDLQTG